MPRFRAFRILIASGAPAALSGLLALAGQPAAADDLPPGPGRHLVENLCSSFTKSIPHIIRKF